MPQKMYCIGKVFSAGATSAAHYWCVMADLLPCFGALGLWLVHPCRARVAAAGRYIIGSYRNFLPERPAPVSSSQEKQSMPQDRFEKALALFDAANAADPNLEEVDGQRRPKELVYAERMSEMLQRFAPDAGEAVKLAVRAQHIQRWTVPRSSYPLTPVGYKQWRTGLYKFHADTAGALMREAGYDEATIEQVARIVAKKGIKVNDDAQLLEDIAALVFLEHYLTAFAAQHPEYDEAKWCDIIRKTWQKMSAKGRDFTLLGHISLPPDLTPLIVKAIT